MTRETAPAVRPRIVAGALAKSGASSLLLLAAAIACARAATAGLPIVIERPAVLVVASLLILVPSRRETVETLQSIAALYLLCIPLNEVHLQYFPVSASLVNIRVAYSAIPLALFGAGHMAERWLARRVDDAPAPPNLVAEWLLAGGIIVVHMLVLGVLLQRFYGYGYEYDLQVLGSLALCFLVFFTCWRQLRRMRMRQALGLVLLAFYIMVAAGKA